jgi:methionine synthase I (cobalamin-dependent)
LTRSQLSTCIAEHSPFLFDGAMGTRLLTLAPDNRAPVDLLSLERPDLVRSVHREYREAGAAVLTTNTFGANRFRMPGREALVERIDRAAVRLAREEAGSCLVAGSIGPSGLHQDLPGDGELREAFREQARALESEGVDMFVCETFGDPRELRMAILGVRDVSSAPLIALMMFTADARTPSGHSPRQISVELEKLPIDAVGVNCGVGEDTVTRVVKELSRSTSLPIAALPNAGEPERNESDLRYPLGPEAFAALLVQLVPYASILGGCCGTTAAHLVAGRAALEANRRQKFVH